jgi:hypothetical protein
MHHRVPPPHPSTPHLARWFEQRINDSVPFTLSAARLYGLTVVDGDGLLADEHQPGAVLASYVTEHADPRRLLRRAGSDLALCHDAVALLVTGWASSLDHELVELSSRGGRRKVRLVVVAGDDGLAAVARRFDRPDHPLAVPGRCLGSLSEGLAELWRSGAGLRTAS